MKKVIDEQIDKITMVQNSQNLKEKLEKQRKMAINNQKLEKETQKRLKREKKQAKKDKQLKREMEIQAYGKFLENQGYKVKYPWTWPRVKRLLIAIFATIITCFILWQIPAVRQNLTGLYNENFIVRTLVNIVVSIFTLIIGAIKGIFK